MKKLLMVLLAITMVIGFAFAQPAPPVVGSGKGNPSDRVPGSFSITAIGEALYIPGATESSDKVKQYWGSLYSQYDFGKIKGSKLAPFFTFAYGVGYQNSEKLSDWGHAGLGLKWKNSEGLDLSLGIRGSYIGDANIRLTGAIYKQFSETLDGMDLITQLEGEYIPPLEKKNGKDFTGFSLAPRVSLVAGDWRFGVNPSYSKDSTKFSDGKEHESIKIGGFVGYKSFELAGAWYKNGWQRYANGDLKPFLGISVAYNLKL